MRTVSRLRLLFLLLRPSSPNPNGFCFAELSTLLLFALSKPSQAHQKHTARCSPQTLRAWVSHDLNASGGPGGSRTRVQNTFLFASYSNNFYLTASVCLPFRLFFRSLNQSSLTFERLCCTSALLSFITNFLTFITFSFRDCDNYLYSLLVCKRIVNSLLNLLVNLTL